MNNAISLTARTREHSGTRTVRQKHKLIERIENIIKSHNKNEIGEIIHELEKLIRERDEAIKKSKNLTKENKALGVIINKLRTQREDYSTEELKKALLDIQDECDKYKTINNDTLANYKTIQDENNTLKVLVSELQDKYKQEINSLLESNKELNEGYDSIKAKYEFYKENYINETKRNNQLQNNNKTLLVEVQKQVIQIKELENKLNEVEKKYIECSQIKYTNKGILIELSNNKIVAEKDKFLNEQVRCEELKEQLKLLMRHKEVAGKTLNECRENLVKQYDELLESQKRLEALEKMRLSDILHISRLESLLTANNINY